MTKCVSCRSSAWSHHESNSSLLHAENCNNLVESVSSYLANNGHLMSKHIMHAYQQLQNTIVLLSTLYFLPYSVITYSKLIDAGNLSCAGTPTRSNPHAKRSVTSLWSTNITVCHAVSCQTSSWSHRNKAV